MNSEPRIWLITGATSGLGRAIAQAALDAGDTVIAAARRPDALDALVTAHPDSVTPVELDVTDSRRIAAVVADVILWHGRIDVLVNNAGRGLVGAVEETSDDDLRRLMELHFFGPATLTRAVLPHMRRQQSGAIVQISSMGGRLSFAGVGGYSATKFALEGLTEALAAEVRPLGITTMIVEPGAFRTGFNTPSALLTSRPIEAYDAIVGPVRDNLHNDDGRQPGDPSKAAAAILTALNSDRPPLRLVLGTDAADMVDQSLRDQRSEFEAWQSIARATAF